jgi:hypothetical protein
MMIPQKYVFALALTVCLTSLLATTLLTLQQQSIILPSIATVLWGIVTTLEYKQLQNDE